MKRADWVKKLEKRLKGLPQDERERVLSYYAEIYEDRINDGQDEEDIIESFGAPDDIAEKIISDYKAYLEREERTTASLSDDEPEPEPEKTEEQPEQEEWMKDYEVHDFSSLAITRLNVSAKSSSVTVRKGARVRIFIKSDENSRFNVSTSGNMLIVQEKGSSVWQNFGIGLAAKDMIVEAPGFDEIIVDAMRGCNVSGMSLKRMTVKGMSGDVRIEDCNTDTELSLSSSGGDVILRGGRHGSASVGTNDGDITVKGVTAKSLSVTTVSGEVSAENINVAEIVKAKSVGGGIRGEKIMGGTVDFKTVSGKVTLALSGKPADYKIYTSTLFGRVSAPSGGAGGRKIYVSTIGGEIDITAVE